MRRIYTVGLIFVCAVSVSYGAVAAKNNPPVRTWKTISGDTVEAKYVEFKYGKVQLQTADGKFLVVPERTLSNEDRAWIKKTEATRNAPAGIKEPSSPNKLPVFSGGENNNYHAVYTAKNFDALMNVNGVIYIYPKENGVRLKKPIRFHMSCYYNDGAHRTRTLVFFNNPSKPVKQPKTVTLSGLLISNVTFSVTYEFSEKGIKGYGYCKDPQDIAQQTAYRILASIPASHKFPKEMSRVELNSQMVGWEVVITPIKGKSRRFAYNKSIPSMSGKDKKLTIDAPAYGKRKIWFKAGKPEEAPIRPWIYLGNCPWQGYVVQLIKNENNKKSKSQYLEMIIE